MTETVALPERHHVHDQVAAELAMDPGQLLAELADAIRTPLPSAGVA